LPHERAIPAALPPKPPAPPGRGRGAGARADLHRVRHRAGNDHPDFVSIPSSTDDVPLPSCPASTLCTFQNYNYGGTRWDYAYSSHPHNQWFYVGSAANDQITSFYNNREYASDFAENCPADNNAYYWTGGGHVSNLNNEHYHWPDGNNMNDSISAIALSTSNNPSYPAHGNC
jgi:Peptidase inhibitor family I36